MMEKKDSLAKSVFYIAAMVGATLGGYLPTIFGSAFLSGWSIIGMILCDLFFLFLAYKFIVKPLRQ